jgi:hypothetical protein
LCDKVDVLIVAYFLVCLVITRVTLRKNIKKLIQTCFEISLLFMNDPRGLTGVRSLDRSF